MSKVSNVISMLQILSNHRKYSVKELAERLEVSERMVRLYKTELEQAGIYIDSLQGPYGGYVLNESYLLPKRGFSKYDVMLLKDALFYLLPNPRFKMEKEFKVLINKVDEMYKGSKQKGSTVLSTDGKNTYNVLSKAIKETLKVKINFMSLDKSAKERVIHPCNLFLYNSDWYVSAFCELRGEIRHFSLPRILNIELLNEIFKN